MISISFEQLPVAELPQPLARSGAADPGRFDDYLRPPAPVPAPPSPPAPPAETPPPADRYSSPDDDATAGQEPTAGDLHDRADDSLAESHANHETSTGPSAESDQETDDDEQAASDVVILTLVAQERLPIEAETATPPATVEPTFEVSTVAVDPLTSEATLDGDAPVPGDATGELDGQAADGQTAPLPPAAELALPDTMQGKTPTDQPTAAAAPDASHPPPEPPDADSEAVAQDGAEIQPAQLPTATLGPAAAGPATAAVTAPMADAAAADPSRRDRGKQRAGEARVEAAAGVREGQRVDGTGSGAGGGTQRVALAPEAGRGPAIDRNSLSAAQTARMIDRVTRAMQSAESRGGVLRLKLSPPELGSLKLELRVQNGVLSARLEADTSQARNLLLDNLPVLRERLQEQGVRVENFDVNLPDRQTGSPSGQPHAQSSSDRGEAASEPRLAAEVPSAPEERRVVRADGRLNVIV